MSRQKPKRCKRYIPKSLPGQIPVTIRFNDDDARTLQLVPHLHLEKLRTRTAEDGTVDNIVARLNIGLVLSNNLFTAAEQVVMCDALDAIRSVKARFASVGKWGASESELNAAHAGLVLVDEMQSNTTRREQKAAIEFVYAKGVMR